MDTLRAHVRYFPIGKGKLATATLALREFRKRRVTHLAKTRTGAVLEVEIDDLVQGYIYLFGVWEPSITYWVVSSLSAGDVFVDVGANIGYYSVLASSIIGQEGLVVAVEPSPHFYSALQRNLKRNNCTNVSAWNLAASDRTDVVLNFVQPDRFNRGNSTAVLAEGSSQALFRAKTELLANLIPDSRLANTRLIKIDVEGFELAALRGMASLFDRLRFEVEILVEISPELLKRQFQSARDIFELLRIHGFNAYKINNDYNVSTYLNSKVDLGVVRWMQPEVPELGDFIFSRRDVNRLEPIKVES